MTKKKNKVNDEDALFKELFDSTDEEDESSAEFESFIINNGISKIIDLRKEGRGAIFLSSRYWATELVQNNPLGITAILDVSAEPKYEIPQGALYLRVPFPDGEYIPPDKFAQCMAFLNSCWEKNMIILVHCWAGASRSPSIVASFMHMNDMGKEFTLPLDTIDKIMDYIKLVRPIVQPNAKVFISCKKGAKCWPYDGSYE